MSRLYPYILEMCRKLAREVMDRTKRLSKFAYASVRIATAYSKYKLLAGGPLPQKYLVTVVIIVFISVLLELLY